MDWNSSQIAPKMPRKEDDDPMGHPYLMYAHDPNWRILNQALDALVANGDLQESTNRVYIVGYLCQALSSSKQD
jgi:hypothetical protein